MSGYPRENGTDDSADLAEAGFLQKPFTEADLTDKLREILDT